jgi:diaminopimelate decarboxylase
MQIDHQILIKAARDYGTPLYLYHFDLIKERYRELHQFIKHPRLKILYAMKANYSPEILKLLINEGAGIDTVSIGEALLATKLGAKSSNLLYTANNVTVAEMAQARNLGLLINIGALSTLEVFGKNFPGSDVCLRFNPEVVAGSHEKIQTGGKLTKFGLLFQDLAQVKELVEKYGLRVVGLHKHTGSGISDDGKYLEAVDNLLQIAIPEHFPNLRFIDLGGGFGVPYQPNEARFNYVAFGQKVTEKIITHEETTKQTLEVWFEPGRYLVCEAGYLLIEVNTIKNNRGRLIVGTDSGFPQLIRPVFYDAYHEIINLTGAGRTKRIYDICGNICETGDHFAKDRELPEIAEGDLLAIKNAGAYCYAMGGVYNLRPMPAEVAYTDGRIKVIRERLSAEDLVDQILGECK